MCTMFSTTIGVFKITMLYAWTKPKGLTIYYRRRVPKSLSHHYKGAYIVRSTGKKDHQSAAKEIARINFEVESEWQRIKDHEKRGLSVEATLADATSLLNDFGLDVNSKDRKNRSAQDEIKSNEFVDHIESKLPYTAMDKINSGADNELFHEVLREYLQPHEIRAVDIFKNGVVLTISEYIDIYARLTGRSLNSKTINDTRTSIQLIVAMFGDRPINEYSRIDANSFVESRLKSGIKTTTIAKNFTLVNAAIEKVNREYELDIKNPFAQPNIPKLGKDKVVRVPFSNNEMDILRDWVQDSDTIITRIIQILMDTGMRLGEVVGLSSNDIKRDDNGLLYIRLKKNEYRRLKNDNSERNIPLVGEALNAVNSIDLSQEWLFPGYLDTIKGEFKSTSASNAVNKRIRTILNNKQSPTAHSFRHTMATRLRNVEAPPDTLREILGWKKDIADKYGSPVSLDIRKEHMLKTLES